jgi:hypothetical protein
MYFIYLNGLGSLTCAHLELNISDVMNFIDSQYDSLDEWSARRKAATYTGQHKQNKRRQTSVPRVGFEPTIPVFHRTMTFHALDSAATVIGVYVFALQ